MFLVLRRRQTSTLFPYTTLFRSLAREVARLSGLPIDEHSVARRFHTERLRAGMDRKARRKSVDGARRCAHRRSEEHTSELQSHSDLVCRLLLAKNKL